MNKFYFFIIVVITLFVASAFAHDEVVPEYMKDGTITVTLKDGKSYSFSTNEYKVVRRGSNAEVDENASSQEEETVVVQQPAKKTENTVILHGGIGNTDLETRRYGSSADVIQQRGLVGGVTLCRSRDNKGACLSGFSNNTITLGLKLDFE